MKDLCNYFKGSWQIHRKIFISDSEIKYSEANGKVLFEIKDNRENYLFYKESGTLRIMESNCEIFFLEIINIYLQNWD